MGMKKAGAVVASETAPVAEQPPIDNAHVAEGCEKFAEPKQPESGAAAALERLSKPTEKPKYSGKIAYEQRDFKKEAEGKVKCVMFEAALQSPAIAGLRFEDIEGFLKLVEKAADAGVAYTWKA